MRIGVDISSLVFKKQVNQIILISGDSDQEKTYTIEDIYALPDGQRAELIDGQIYDLAPPAREHQPLFYHKNYRR